MTRSRQSTFSTSFFTSDCAISLLDALRGVSAAFFSRASMDYCSRLASPAILSLPFSISLYLSHQFICLPFPFFFSPGCTRRVGIYYRSLVLVSLPVLYGGGEHGLCPDISGSGLLRFDWKERSGKSREVGVRSRGV